MVGDTGSGHDRGRPPRYVSALLDDFASGRAGRFNHLGHWDAPVDGHAGGLRAAQRRLNDLVVDLAGVRPGSSVLDVGCGFGGTIAAIAESIADVRLLGVDVDRRQLALNGDVAAGRAVVFAAADAGALPVRSGAFDHVLSIEAMWHFPSRRGFLAEVARVLRPGGSLAVVDVLIAPAAITPERSLADLLSILDGGFAPWPDPTASVASIIDLAAGVGLDCTASLDATDNTKPTYRDHEDVDERPGASAFSAEPSVRLFTELHLTGGLTIACLAFVKRS